MHEIHKDKARTIKAHVCIKAHVLITYLLEQSSINCIVNTDPLKAYFQSETNIYLLLKRSPIKIKHGSCLFRKVKIKSASSKVNIIYFFLNQYPLAILEIAPAADPIKI